MAGAALRRAGPTDRVHPAGAVIGAVVLHEVQRVEGDLMDILYKPAPKNREREQLEDLPLFHRPTASQSARDLVRLKARLEPVALGLAKRRGAEGITASEVITEGLVAGVLNADAVAAAPRLYAWVGPWLAALARRGALSAKMLPLQGGGSVQAMRASERDQSHGNLGKVYLHPERAG